MSPPLNRREFLHAVSAGLIAGSAITGCDSTTAMMPPGGSPPGDPPVGGQDSGPQPPPDPADQGSMNPIDIPQAPIGSFPMGVASGDADATSVVLWTRYVGSNPTMRVRVWDPTTFAVIADQEITVADGGYVHHLMSGLTPGTWYAYMFFEATGTQPVARSPIGRVRTALEDSTSAPLVFGASACAFNTQARMKPLEAAGQRTDLDAFFLLGDTSYNDGCDSVDDYRARWQGNLSKDGYRALRASTSVVATWDDHEVGNNWSPETIDPALLARATQVFFENTPARRDPTAPNRIWRSRRWGKTAELFVLDCRSERLPSTRQTATAQYISRAQMDWLKAGLAASPCTFKLILNSVPVASFPAGFDLGNSLLEKADRWEGYASARTELLTHIEGAGIQGVVFVSGDFHLASMGRAAKTGLGSQTVELLTGPVAQISQTPFPYLLTAPQFDFASGRYNYLAMHLDPSARTLKAVFHGDDGAPFGEHTYSF